MTGFKQGTLVLALLCAAPASAAPAGLDAGSVEKTRSFLTTLAADIKAALAADEGARDRLLTRGGNPKSLGRELDELAKLTREAGGLEAVRFNTFALRGTVWFGVVPVKEVELHMVLAPDRMRLLRTVVRDTRMRIFGRPRAVEWSDEGAKAFGTLASQMIGHMTEGDCAALPRIRSADHKALLPGKRKARQKTLAVFKRFDGMIVRGCEALDKVPNHRVTWRFGELGGSVSTEGAHPVSFKLTLTHDSAGVPKIFHLRGRPRKQP